MSKTIQVDYSNGESEDLEFPNKLYDLNWNEYKPIERTIKLNASTDRNGNIQEIHLGEDEFLVELQEAIALAILNRHSIELSEVKVSTVKRIIEEYGDDPEELNVKLKKKSSE